LEIQKGLHFMTDFTAFIDGPAAFTTKNDR
jgi:hypothetical protein